MKYSVSRSTVEAIHSIMQIPTANELKVKRLYRYQPLKLEELPGQHRKSLSRYAANQR